MSEYIPIPGANRYAINSTGRVIRVYRVPMRMKPWNDRGYPSVQLITDDGKVKRYHIHRLVAAIFIGPKPAGMLVLHKDDNPENYAVDNLYYGTHLQNYRDSVRNGKRGKKRNSP